MKLRNKEFDEIFEVITFGYVDSKTPNGNGDYPVEVISLEVMDEDGDNYEYRYRSLKDLNAVWEDCTPAEPLIKDEKIRKAVRAWAEANGLDEVAYVARSNSFGRFGYSIMFDYDFDLHDGLEDARFYTIAELCGEEEE